MFSLFFVLMTRNEQKPMIVKRVVSLREIIEEIRAISLQIEHYTDLCQTFGLINQILNAIILILMLIILYFVVFHPIDKYNK